MTTSEIQKVKMENIVEEANRHVYRLELAHKKLYEFFPLSPEKYNSFSDSQIETLDQFIYRFTKLQDCIGCKMFPLLYSMTQPVEKTVPFLDILHWLEKLEIIDSANTWQTLRNIRNELSHEYPHEIQESIITLNNLYSKSTLLVTMYENARKYYFKKLT